MVESDALRSESLEVTLGPSIRLHGGSGEPLLLLHPFALCADAWRPVLPALASRHEVLVATFPGHMGGDPIPPGFRHSIAASVDLARSLGADPEHPGLRVAPDVGIQHTDLLSAGDQSGG